VGGGGGVASTTLTLTCPQAASVESRLTASKEQQPAAAKTAELIEYIVYIL
jgi:hypothetical protein